MSDPISPVKLSFGGQFKERAKNYGAYVRLLVETAPLDGVASLSPKSPTLRKVVQFFRDSEMSTRQFTGSPTKVEVLGNNGIARGTDVNILTMGRKVGHRLFTNVPTGFIQLLCRIGVAIARPFMIIGMPIYQLCKGNLKEARVVFVKQFVRMFSDIMQIARHAIRMIPLVGAFMAFSFDYIEASILALPALFKKVERVYACFLPAQKSVPLPGSSSSGGSPSPANSARLYSHRVPSALNSRDNPSSQSLPNPHRVFPDLNSRGNSSSQSLPTTEVERRQAARQVLASTS